MGSSYSSQYEAPSPAFQHFIENRRIFETRNPVTYEYHYNGSTGPFKYSTGEYCKK